MINGLIHQESIRNINIYMRPTSEQYKYIKQTLTELKGEIDNNSIKVDFNTPLSTKDRTSRLNINKEIKDFIAL